MQGFNPQDITHSVVLHFSTDTQHPQPVIPVYHLHSLEKPFCSNLCCSCHQSQEQVTHLLQAIQQGELLVQDAVDFTDGKKS